VNRPFSAFGVLLALLSLTMLAVGSGSRTSPPTARSSPARPSHPQRPGARASLAAHHGQPKARALRGSTFVVILPETAPARSSPKRPAVIEVASAPHFESTAASEPCADAAPRGRVTPVRIVPAAADALPSAAQVECRAFHDAQCDRAVDGDATAAPDEGGNRSTSSDRLPADAAPLGIDELLDLMHSLTFDDPAQALESSAQWRSHGACAAQFGWNLLALDADALAADLAPQWRASQLLARGVFNRLAHALDVPRRLAVWPLAPSHTARAGGPGWDDYAAAIDRLQPAPSPAAAAEANATAVRSGHWLIRFAASALNDAASALQSAAGQLERLDATTSAREPSPLAR
jgi:hypothetical protein